MSKDKKRSEGADTTNIRAETAQGDQSGQRPPSVAQEVFKEAAQVTPCVSDGHTAYAAGLWGNVVTQGHMVNHLETSQALTARWEKGRKTHTGCHTSTIL